ncbi:MAG TPA: SCO family protein [Pyrinomonadaceae bacterium]|nr:SCO family protein [Pyrinomonadaceae bacterium]
MSSSCKLSCNKKSPPFATTLKLFASALLCCLASLQAAGQQQAQQPPPHPASSRPSQQKPPTDNLIHETKLEVPDVWVMTQDGKRLRFYTDLVKGRKVAIGFFYTTCTFICTRHGEFFARLQTALRDRLGKDVFLISVTMDPLTDTPAKLTRWGQTYRRQPGWTLVTGSVADLSRVLKVFTGNTAGPRDDHSSLFYIADDQTGSWHFADALISPAAVLEKLDASPPTLQAETEIYSRKQP